MIPAVMPTYNHVDLAFERGEGAYLFAADGRRYLDFASGIAVTALGHAHPHLVRALSEQAQRLWHCSNLFRIPGQERLAERLTAACFADSVFFSNSGAEALECGLKMVRKYHDEFGEPGRYRVITCAGAFHGRTLATIAAGRQEKHLNGFAPIVDGETLMDRFKSLAHKLLRVRREELEERQRHETKEGPRHKRKQTVSPLKFKS